MSAVVPADELGLPGQVVGQRIARVLAHERFEIVLFGRPPAGIVPRLGLRMVGDLDAELPQIVDVGLDDGRGVEPIAPAVDDEERLVDGVSGMHVPVGRHGRIGEHTHVAVERQKARPRRRLAKRHEVGAGAAVGDARQADAVFVDVVGPLQPIEDPEDVLDLVAVPPLRLSPPDRVAVNLIGRAGDPIDTQSPRIGGLA